MREKQSNAKRYIDADHHKLRNESTLARRNKSDSRNKFYEQNYEYYNQKLDTWVDERPMGFSVQLPPDEFKKLKIHIAAAGLNNTSWLRKIIRRMPNPHV
ncbi:MAG TPA: hypothetical protein VGK47_14030 [Nitrososphaeraceae archaeon]